MQVTSNDVSSLADEGETTKPTQKDTVKVSTTFERKILFQASLINVKLIEENSNLHKSLAYESSVYPFKMQLISLPLLPPR